MTGGRRQPTLLLLGLLVIASLSAFLLPRPAAALNPHAPILILSDADFTPANGVTGGNGTAGDPYVIDNWDISASTANAIEIRGTTAYFVIRNVSLHDGRATGRYGVYLYNVLHGWIDNATIANNYYGVYQSGGGWTNITRSTFTDNQGAGVYATSSTYTNIGTSSITNSVYGVYAQYTSYTNVTASNLSGVSYGLYLSSATSPRVDNTSFYNNNYGIYSSFASGLQVTNSTFSWNRNGILLYFTTSATIRNNRFLNNGVRIQAGASPSYFNGHVITADNLVNGRPLYYYKNCNAPYLEGVPAGQVIVASCTNVHLGNLTLDHTDIGVELAYVTNANVIGVAATYMRTYGIAVYYGSGVNVTGGNYSNNGDTGVFLGSTANPRVRNALATRNGNGIYASGGSAPFVSGNNASYNTYGIYVSAPSAQVNNNTVLGSGSVGIYLGGSTAAAVRDNNASRGLYGVYAYAPGSATVAGNALYGNSVYGLYAYSSSGLLADRNNLSANYYGGYLYGLTNPRITNNTFYRNSAYGLYLYLTTGASIHRNNFVGNGVQAYDSYGAANAWDSGYPGGGNFWSPYGGKDECSGVNQTTCTGPDGIGDTPFAVDGDTRDRYPKMRQQGVFDTAPIAYVVLSAPYVATQADLTVDASASWDQEDLPFGLQVRWDWDGDGIWDTPFTTTKTATHQYSVPGSFVLRVEVRDPYGLSNVTSRTVGVALSPLRAAISSRVTSGTTALTVAFSATTLGGVTPFAYAWDFGDGNQATGATASHTYGAPGNYTVTLTVTDGMGQTARTTAVVTVAAPPSPPPSPQPVEASGLLVILVAVASAAAGAGLGVALGRRRRALPQVVVEEPRGPPPPAEPPAGPPGEPPGEPPAEPP